MSLGRTGDRRIIERVLEGDIHSFNLLVCRREKPIHNYIFKVAENTDEAMDLCQETFMKAFSELRSLKGRN